MSYKANYTTFFSGDISYLALEYKICALGVGLFAFFEHFYMRLKSKELRFYIFQY